MYNPLIAFLLTTETLIKKISNTQTASEYPRIFHIRSKHKVKDKKSQKNVLKYN